MRQNIPDSQDSQDVLEQQRERAQYKKGWLDSLMDLVIAFRSASLASGGATVVTGSNNNSISTNEIFLNQAALAVFFGGVIFILVFLSLVNDYCIGRASEEGYGRTLARTVSGKKRQTVLSAAFSMIGGIMMFTQVNGESSNRNKTVLAFSILAQLFSGVLIGPDARKLPGRFGQFFQDPALQRVDTMATLPSFRARNVPIPRLTVSDLAPSPTSASVEAVEPYNEGPIAHIEEVPNDIHLRVPPRQTSAPLHSSVNFAATARPHS